MARTAIIQIGEALYGPLFQSALARDLGVSDRTMRRWVAGTHEPPEGLQDELRALVRARIALLQKLLPKR
jgi:DNA-binding transcriptional regulator YiaG